MNDVLRAEALCCECCQTPISDHLVTEHGVLCSEECYETEKRCAMLRKSIEVGGVASATMGNAEQFAETIIFGAERGHGFAAEKANHMTDVLNGEDAKLVGQDNAKNGADRLVNGNQIQTKYCRTGSKCVSECFDESGMFKYLNPDGSPMQIEVPSDKYDDALRAMEHRIRKGQVKGVHDPAKAKEIVRKGNITYQQARNIAKFGTVESVLYDAASGVRTAGTAMGLSATVTFAVAIWNGKKWDAALVDSCRSGLLVGGSTWVSGIIASQVARTGIENSMRPATDWAVKQMGSKACAILANAARDSGTRIYGAAAMNHVSKLLRGNLITGAVSTLVLSSADITRLVRGRISGGQAFKNVAATAAGTAGGTGGWIAGAAAGAAIGSAVPVVGTAIGGIAGGLFGGFLGGTAAATATKAALDSVIEDDAKQMAAIFESELARLAEEFMLGEDEIERLLTNLQELKLDKEFREIYAARNRVGYVTSLIKPRIVDVVSQREKVAMPTEDEVLNGTRLLLESLDDCFH
jgi:hypothetical protein